MKTTYSKLIKWVRGITICIEWINSFESFLSDIGTAPSPKHQLDRIDVNGNYEKSNCRWITHQENCLNTRANRFLTFNGITKTHTEWERELGLYRGAIYNRLYMGWQESDCLKPKGTKRGE